MWLLRVRDNDPWTLGHVQQMLPPARLPCRLKTERPYKLFPEPKCHKVKEQWPLVEWKTFWCPRPKTQCLHNWNP